MNGFIFAVVIAILLFLTTHATASETRSGAGQGFYFGTDIGVSVPHELESTRTNFGIPTNCDQWLDQFTFDDGTEVPFALEQCQPEALPGSPNGFNLGTGLLAGVNLGYAVRNFRIEAEYFRREQSGERLPLILPSDSKQQEFVERSEHISDFRGNNFFANLYYDLRSMISPKTIPYVGVGLGLMHTTMNYSGTTIRKGESELIALKRNPNAAGTASLANEVLSDTLLGYQWIAGVDYALSEQFYAGVKLRYGASFDDFKDGDHEWAPLRNHGSTVGPPGTPGGDLPVLYEINADKLHFWGIALSLKYFFDI